MKHTVDCLAFWPVEKSTFRGFAKIRIRPASDAFSDAVWRAVEAMASLEESPR